ncbi:hypothetical protein D3C80_1007340 [compost metagenome]
MRRLRSGFFNDLLIAAAKAELAQHVNVWTLLRWDHRLHKTGVRQRFHFLQPLLGRQLWIRDLESVFRRRFVAKRQSSVMVGQPHQPVKVDFTRFHDHSPG